MKNGFSKPVRCAIYTRVSTEQGLDQDFNSLDAQRDASQAYIRSQAHAGWTQIRNRYDDGGYSGGTTERPALKRLLDDIKAGKVDVIVVYKVDRLTRSLADFAKLVELFDRHTVSFVSVTQQFNTTTSMGRLTLNVLLSFAQFEREVTSERIRDKIAASKRKGLWVGGMVPLGYKVKNRKVVVIKKEAERVRMLFQSYLELGSLNRLLEDLRDRNILTRVRTLSTGRTIGGIPFMRGSLRQLLRNRFYIGEVIYKGEICPAEHSPILDRDLFDAVQRKLEEQRASHHSKVHAGSDSLLMGRIFDDRGNRMTPSFTRKGGKRYRYYVSSALLQGQAKLAGYVRRASSAEIEGLVLRTIRKRLEAPESIPDRDLINLHIDRVEVQQDSITVKLTSKSGRPSKKLRTSSVVHIPWQKVATKRQRDILLPASANDIRPIRSETRATLVAAIARGRHWLDELVTGVATDVEQIAVREKCSARQVNLTISLAFLSPTLVKAAVEGRLPRGIGVARLRDAPAEWSRQHTMLGLGS
jgi:DNA invertase Pin-like site-specific DNA recombinase